MWRRAKDEGLKKTVENLEKELLSEEGRL